MKKLFLSLIFTLILFCSSAQVPDWQEQILSQTDLENVDVSDYNNLVEELSELWLMRDTTRYGLFGGKFRQQLIWRSDRTLEERKGPFEGDPWRHTIRYRAQLDKQWQAGLTYSKNSGERWGDNLHGFVNYTNNNHWLQQAVIGHYRIQAGCGLIVNQQFSLGKQYMGDQLLTLRNRISGHASTGDASHMQGAAARIRIGEHLGFMPWASIQKLSGNQQAVLGLSTSWDAEWWHVGANIQYIEYRDPIEVKPSYYNRNYFQGRRLMQGSIDYTAIAYGFTLRGETAIDDGGGIATINALKYKPNDSEWQYAIIGRYYSKQYHQLLARSLSEGSKMQAEAGVTLNVSGTPWRHWKVKAMADLFSMGAPQYGHKQDSLPKGWEGYVRATYSRSRWDASLTYRYKQKHEYQRHSIEGQINLHPTPHLSFRTQAKSRIYREDNTSSQTPSLGYLISQSAGWKSDWRKGSMNINGQFAFFDTDDYDSRVYLTEKNILYGFGIPMLYGKGVRYSLTASVSLLNHLVFDLKYALTNYANRSTISSGAQQIKGNTQQQIWLQLRIKI